MAYISTSNYVRQEMPAGKITIRWRSSRNVFQCYAGSAFLDGASGDDPEKAADALRNAYNLKLGEIASVYGYKDAATINL